MGLPVDFIRQDATLEFTAKQALERVAGSIDRFGVDQGLVQDIALFAKAGYLFR